MKYGEVLNFRTKGKAVVGKTYVFSDILYELIDSPQVCVVNILRKVEEATKFPFIIEGNFKFQFVREIIEEEPKYRPYKDPAEMIADFSKRAGLSDNPLSTPNIWVKDKATDECSLIVKFGESKVVFVDDFYHTMEEILNCFTYLDDSPCGIKED